MDSPEMVRLTRPSQRKAFAAAARQVTADTDKPCLSSGEVVRALALAYLGRDGWDDVGDFEPRRGPPTEVWIDE